MNKMTTLVIKRLALGCLSLWFVSVIILVGVDFLPGDIATEILGQSATPEAVAAFRQVLGLDQPLHIRYIHWLSAFVQGDFGNSLANGRQIAELLGSRLLNTLFLASVTAVIAVPLALGLGFLAAIHRNGVFDRMINSATLTFISFPEFFLAYLLILLFSVKAGWLPSLANVDASQPLLERLYRVTLPALTLTLVVMAHMMRMTRAAIINLLASPYIEMATLKGVPGWRVILRHALPNAWAPIINVIVLNLAYLIVGVVVVEVVFVYPGMGQLMVDSVKKRDMPVVQACSLVFAATYIVLNLTADVLSVLTNPRLRHPK